MTLPRLSLLPVIVLAMSLVGCHREVAKAYPLDKCLISGEKLGNHGDPYVFVRDGQEVKLCCESCLEDFNANAGKFLKELAEKAKP